MAIAHPPASGVDTAGAPLDVGDARWNDLLRFCLLNRTDLRLLAEAELPAPRVEGLPESFPWSSATATIRSGSRRR
jgi:hypothetical protein